MTTLYSHTSPLPPPTEGSMSTLCSHTSLLPPPTEGSMSTLYSQTSPLPPPSKGSMSIPSYVYSVFTNIWPMAAQDISSHPKRWMFPSPPS